MDGLAQLTLTHLATSLDVELFCQIVQLITRTFLKNHVQVPGALGPLAWRAPFHDDACSLSGRQSPWLGLLRRHVPVLSLMCSYCRSSFLFQDGIMYPPYNERNRRLILQYRSALQRTFVDPIAPTRTFGTQARALSKAMQS